MADSINSLRKSPSLLGKVLKRAAIKEVEEKKASLFFIKKSYF